jgi:hypothetical protein
MIDSDWVGCTPYPSDRNCVNFFHYGVPLLPEFSDVGGGTFVPGIAGAAPLSAISHCFN